MKEDQRRNWSPIRWLLAIVWPGRLLVRELTLAKLAEIARATDWVAPPALDEKTRALLNGNAVDRSALQASHESSHPDEVVGGGKPMHPLPERRAHGSTR